MGFKFESRFFSLKNLRQDYYRSHLKLGNICFHCFTMYYNNKLCIMKTKVQLLIDELYSYIEMCVQNNNPSYRNLTSHCATYMYIAYTNTDNNILARCNLQGVCLVYTQLLLTTTLPPIVNFFLFWPLAGPMRVGYEGFYCILIWLSSINKLSNEINEIVKF